MNIPIALQAPAADCEIRPVRWEDVEGLRARCWPERSVVQMQRLVSRALRLEQHHYGRGLVAVEADGIVGYGQFTHWPRAAEISDLVVCAERRGQGIGTALIQALVQQARERAIARVEIGVALNNPRALALYRRLGFSDNRVVHLDLNGERTAVLYLELVVSPH
jgi:ribosomal protein S18 acetylase RimI-like enzyme